MPGHDDATYNLFGVINHFGTLTGWTFGVNMIEAVMFQVGTILLMHAQVVAQKGVTTAGMISMIAKSPRLMSPMWLVLRRMCYFIVSTLLILFLMHLSTLSSRVDWVESLGW